MVAGVGQFGDVELSGRLWNRATLDMFAEFIRGSPPIGKAKGAHVSADAISSYVMLGSFRPYLG